MTDPKSKPLVLIIDDDPRIREGLSRRLRNDDFAIATAACGSEALPLVRSRAVAVAVCDETMPGQSGITVLQSIKDCSPQTVRIMLTGAPCVSLALRAINRVGVSHFFTKPCDHQELLDTIRRGIRDYNAAVASDSRTSTRASRAGPRVYEIELDSTESVEDS